MHEQATLVAFYGDKPDLLASLISELQETTSDELGSAFSGYSLEQVHATIVGLEGTADDPRVNQNGACRGGRREAMNLPGFLRSLREGDDLPFSVQLGGFVDRHYPFESRCQGPDQRSFSIQGEYAVLMGWPVSAGTSLDAVVSPRARDARADRNEAEPSYPATLGRIRRSAESFHIHHQYHLAAVDFDNDLYLRLGTVDRDRIPDALSSSLEERARERLGGRPATLLPVGVEDLSVVSYTDRSLPWPESRRCPLPEIDLGADLVDLFHRALPEPTG